MRHPVLLALAWLPCVLCAAAWAGSDWCGAMLVFRQYRVDAQFGVVCVHGAGVGRQDEFTVFRPNPGDDGSVERVCNTTPQPWAPARVLRFDVHTPRPQTFYLVRLWAVTLALTLPAAWLTDRWRHDRRGTPGLCPACGYDLRATPGRCPECGNTNDSLRRSGSV